VSGPNGRSANRMRQSVILDPEDLPLALHGVWYCTRIVGGHRIAWIDYMTPRDGGMTALMTEQFNGRVGV